MMRIIFSFEPARLKGEENVATVPDPSVLVAWPFPANVLTMFDPDSKFICRIRWLLVSVTKAIFPSEESQTDDGPLN
jgi:hypothetical protein